MYNPAPLLRAPCLTVIGRARASQPSRDLRHTEYICDRVRENQAFVRFSDYCRFCSALSIRIVLQKNLKTLARSSTKLRLFFPQRSRSSFHKMRRFRQIEAFLYSWSVTCCNDYACGSKRSRKAISRKLLFCLVFSVSPPDSTAF